MGCPSYTLVEKSCLMDYFAKALFESSYMKGEGQNLIDLMWKALHVN
jgi:hypothetical protein